MRTDLLSLLRCPSCHGTLTLETYAADPVTQDVTAGLIYCTCSLEFAVWRGVPHLALEPERRMPLDFVKAYPSGRSAGNPKERPASVTTRAALFDSQWDMYKFSRYTWGDLDLDTRIRYFQEYLQLPLEDLKGKWVLDAGCGNGTLSAALAAHGLLVVAFDYSNVVERAEQHRAAFAGNGTVHFLLADVLAPPFAGGLFDVIYSDGVVHLTPDPRTAFARLASLLRPGGRLLVSVSRHDRRPLFALHRLITEVFRKVALRMPISFGKIIGFLVAVALNAIDALKAFVTGNKMPRVPVSQRAFALWHSFVQPDLHYYSIEELQSWFREEGFAAVSDQTLAGLSDKGCAALGILPDLSDTASEIARCAR